MCTVTDDSGSLNTCRRHACNVQMQNRKSYMTVSLI